jgi:flagellar basal body rod protein FlgC
VLNANVKTSTNQSSGYGINKQPSITSKTELRRFHLSRSSIPTPAGLTSGYLRGAKGPPAVFTERKRTPGLQNKVSNTSLAREIGTLSQTASTSHRKNGDEESQLPSTDNQSRPPAPLRNVKMPSGRVVPWDTDSATLAAQMQAYTMQEIGHNLAKSSTSETSVTSRPVIRARQVSSFKPKAPTLRYHEQHPEKARAADAKKDSNQDEVMTDAADQDGDDSDYVMETYIRMPAEMFECEEQKSVGLLVLDSQPDIDEFYNDDSDSDSEIYDEEEDENGESSQSLHGKKLTFVAENHPSTDYPEDEVESDDEYGRNPYGRYRNQNASDNEEYDEDVTYSDDDAKPQWARRPWMVNNPYRRNEEHEVDDD